LGGHKGGQKINLSIVKWTGPLWFVHVRGGRGPQRKGKKTGMTKEGGKARPSKKS